MFHYRILFTVLALLSVSSAAPACDFHHSKSTHIPKPTLAHLSASSASTILLASTTSFSTPSASSSTTLPNGGSTKPTLGLDTTFIVDLDNQPIAAPSLRTKSGVNVSAEIYIVDGEGSTAAQISEYHTQGKTVVCYFSAGTWEPGRSDALKFDPSCYCGAGVGTDSKGVCTGNGAKENYLGDWNEWYLDIHSPTCSAKVQTIMRARMQSFADKGCDGVDPDNVDAFTNTQNFGITAQDEVNYLLALSKSARSLDLLIDLKNSGSLLSSNGKATTYQQSLVEAFDFNVIEACHEYNECKIYDSFLAAGKPQIQLEYSSSITSCPTLSKGQNLLVYSGTNLDSGEITLQCSA